MKYLTVIMEPIKIKGDTDDMDTLRADLYEKLQAMEAEDLDFYVEEEDNDEDDDS